MLTLKENMFNADFCKNLCSYVDVLQNVHFQEVSSFHGAGIERYRCVIFFFQLKILPVMNTGGYLLRKTRVIRQMEGKS